MPIQNIKGFTLIELITVLLIISVLAIISFPLYTQHLVEAQRDSAKASLLDLASRMENYYLANGSYEAATLAELGVNELTEDGGYSLAINTASLTSYSLSATPTEAQNDPVCGNLTLTETGQKGMSGTGTMSQCW
jgi:type IV pilus assembly protein PilE